MQIPRLFGWLIATFVLLLIVLLIAPHQLPVSLYKLSLISTAGVVGYWLDRSIFPYARPDSYLACKPAERHRRAESIVHDADYRVNRNYELIFAAAMLRRAIVVGGAMLAMGLGA